LDEEIHAQKGIFAFRLRLRKFSKKQISCIQEKDFLPFASQLLNQRCFLGDTAKRASESSAGLDLAHHIVGVDDAELDLRCGMEERSMGKIQNESEDQKNKNFLEFHETLFLIRPM
jgi:hypothetical protein